MDNFDRSNILKNLNFLVSSTKYDVLVNACVHYPPLENGFVFFGFNMKQHIEYEHKTVQERHVALIKKITKRGPLAYSIFKEILKANKFISALDKLNESDQSIRNNFNNNRIAKAPQRPLLPRAPDVTVKSSAALYEPEQLSDYDLRPLEIEGTGIESDVIKSKTIVEDSKLGVYPMTKRKKGVLFLVNITKFECNVERERNGSIFDTERLVYLFNELDFYIFKEEDITRGEFLHRLSVLLNSKYCKEVECFVMALMSHGIMNDRKDAYVTFYDNRKEDVHNILDNFSNRYCKALVKKPKIILFPFCRGDCIDIGVPDTASTSETEHDALLTSNPTNLPAFSDMLICYGSLPGFVTNREPQEGSWYITALYEVFSKNAHDTHVEDMIKMIGPKILELYDHKKHVSRQTPIYWNYAFNKHLYFNPGCYIE